MLDAKRFSAMNAMISPTMKLSAIWSTGHLDSRERVQARNIQGVKREFVGAAHRLVLLVDSSSARRHGPPSRGNEEEHRGLIAVVTAPACNVI
jgi:hypothetical protein